MNYEINVHRIVRQKKGDNQYIERHSHDFFHFMYILNGEGRIIVENNVYDVKKYDLVMAPPKAEHEIFGKKDLITLDLKFTCNDEMLEMLKGVGYYIKGVSIYSDKLIHNIFEEALDRRDMFDHIINLKMLELLYLIIRYSSEGKNEDGDECRILGQYENKARFNEIKPALNYIDDNISKPIKAINLSIIMGFSESYFSTLFKDIMGIPPVKYINLRKCEKAKELMFYTGMNITAISEYLGFETVHYFSRVFKKTVGISPKAYLNRGAKDVIVNVEKDKNYCGHSGYEIPMRSVDGDDIEASTPYEIG